MTYSARAHRYARRVVGGKIPAAKWTKLACRRQLDDLKRWPQQRRQAPLAEARPLGGQLA